MTLATLLLVLASAAIHATWNLWIKQLRDDARGATIAFTLTLLSGAIYLPFAIATVAMGSWRPTPAILPWVLGTGVLHVVYFLVLLRGYKVGDLSLVYPLARGTGPLIAFIGAMLWFGERPTPLATGGALLVAAGVFLLAARPDLPRRHAASAGILYGVLTGLLIGAYTLWDGWAVKHVHIPPLFYYWAGEMARIVLYSPLALRDRGGPARLLRAHRWRMIGIATLSPLSYILILLALRTGPVSHIAPARELSILIGAWLGGQVLGEGERVRRLAAAAAIAGGVIALALA